MLLETNMYKVYQAGEGELGDEGMFIVQALDM